MKTQELLQNASFQTERTKCPIMDENRPKSRHIIEVSEHGGKKKDSTILQREKNRIRTASDFSLLINTKGQQ